MNMIITRWTPDDSGGFYSDTGDYVPWDDVEELLRRLDIARCALADIATSSDMTLAIAKEKAKRIYNETA